MRKKLAIANWKMNKNRSETQSFCRQILIETRDLLGVELVVCPPFTALDLAAAAFQHTLVRWGGQNCFWEEKGAYTGEISAAMLRDLGCDYVIIGHSERRQILGENDAAVNRKLAAALQAGLTPVLCVGETLQERENQRARDVVKQQLSRALQNLTLTSGSLVIAYEPVWAIGTGVNASSGDAQQMIGFIREQLAVHAGQEAAAAISILYGGSVRSDNIAEIMAEKDIDGALIGGASLLVDSFAAIARYIADA